MVLQGRKSSPQKSRPPESGHRRHGVWIAIEYSYKLGQKKEFKFLCVPGWFSQIQSHIIARVLLFVARQPRTDEKQMLNNKLRRVGEDKITITKVCVSTYHYIH